MERSAKHSALDTRCSLSFANLALVAFTGLASVGCSDEEPRVKEAGITALAQYEELKTLLPQETRFSFVRDATIDRALMKLSVLDKAIEQARAESSDAGHLFALQEQERSDVASLYDEIFSSISSARDGSEGGVNQTLLARSYAAEADYYLGDIGSIEMGSEGRATEALWSFIDVAIGFEQKNERLKLQVGRRAVQLLDLLSARGSESELEEFAVFFLGGVYGSEDRFLRIDSIDDQAEILERLTPLVRDEITDPLAAVFRERLSEVRPPESLTKLGWFLPKLILAKDEERAREYVEECLDRYAESYFLDNPANATEFLDRLLGSAKLLRDNTFLTTALLNRALEVAGSIAERSPEFDGPLEVLRNREQAYPDSSSHPILF